MANPSTEAVLAILEPLPDPVILVEPRRRVEQAHAAARDALGGDPVGCDLSLGLRDPVLLEAVDAMLAGGEPREVDFELAVQPERRFAARIVPSTRINHRLIQTSLRKISTLQMKVSAPLPWSAALPSVRWNVGLIMSPALAAASIAA